MRRVLALLLTGMAWAPCAALAQQAGNPAVAPERTVSAAEQGAGVPGRPATAQEQGSGSQQASPAEGEESADEKVPRWAKEPWEKIRFGVKAGATWATLSGQLPIPEVGTFGFDGDYGFAASFSFEIPLSRQVSIQPEAQIVRKHAQIDLSDSTYQGSEKLSANYIEVPVLLKWYPGRRHGTIFNFQAGAAVGFRMDAIRESRHADGTIRDIEGSTLVKATDWGVIGGVGVEFHEFIWALTLDLRYNHGLSNIDNSRSGSETRWRTLYLVAGVTW